MQELFHHKSILILLGASVVLLFVSFIFIISSVNNLSTPLILHFDVNGIDRYGGVIDLWGIWTVGLGIGLINTFLGRSFFFRERVLGYVFFGATPLLLLFFLIAIATIISVN